MEFTQPFLKTKKPRRTDPAELDCLERQKAYLAALAVSAALAFLTCFLWLFLAFFSVFLAVSAGADSAAKEEVAKAAITRAARIFFMAFSFFLSSGPRTPGVVGWRRNR